MVLNVVGGNDHRVNIDDKLCGNISELSAINFSKNPMVWEFVPFYSQIVGELHVKPVRLVFVWDVLFGSFIFARWHSSLSTADSSPSAQRKLVFIMSYCVIVSAVVVSNDSRATLPFFRTNI